MFRSGSVNAGFQQPDRVFGRLVVFYPRRHNSEGEIQD
jgi:hypothetical protein